MLLNKIRKTLDKNTAQEINMYFWEHGVTIAINSNGKVAEKRYSFAQIKKMANQEKSSEDKMLANLFLDLRQELTEKLKEAAVAVNTEMIQSTAGNETS